TLKSAITIVIPGLEPSKHVRMSGSFTLLATVKTTLVGIKTSSSIESQTEVSPATVVTSEGTGVPALAQYNQPVYHQSYPSLLAIMQQMTQIMANLQEAFSFDDSRPPAFNIQSMKAPACFYGTQPFKSEVSFSPARYCFRNGKANSCGDMKQFLYAISFLIGRAAKWMEPHISNVTN
ncbi:hypothetical protein O181_100706, partial [Austropuccinia psidii MF-1]|nr:hypothetical protein [Austropuccinia psidii MF-1]